MLPRSLQLKNGKIRLSVGILVFLLGIAPRGAESATSTRRTPVVEAVERALPSVVNIGTEKLVKVSYSDPQRNRRGNIFDQYFFEFYGPPRFEKKQALGSGVIIDARGYILTNYHVVQRAARIQVTLANGVQYDGRLIAGEETSDLALIKINPPGDLKEVDLGTDDDLLLGETVIVLGNPFGLGHTVTVGVLSAKNREAEFNGEVLYRDILQTDAAVNPGSSGGPLLNVDAQLIGINVAVHRDAQNIGFAIPVRRARQLLTEWMAPARLDRIWLGFSAEQSHLGLEVDGIQEKGPAAAAGLLPGDRIVSINGRKVPTVLDAYKQVLGTRPGGPVDLEIQRSGRVLWLRLTAARLPIPEGFDIAQEKLGIEFRKKQPNDPVVYKGLLVEEVEPGSPADQAGITPGLLITRINQVEVNDIGDAALALSSLEDHEWIEVDVVELEERKSLLVALTSRLRLLVH